MSFAEQMDLALRLSRAADAEELLFVPASQVYSGLGFRAPQVYGLVNLRFRSMREPRFTESLLPACPSTPAQSAKLPNTKPDP